MSKIDRPFTGSVDELLENVSSEKGVRLDKDKLDFLSMISKTKYSGLTTPKLISAMINLEEKNDDWFIELLDDGLAEKLPYQTPQSKVRQTFEGWFITSEGRKILKEILKKM